jgi:chemotaxis protein MotB
MAGKGGGAWKVAYADFVTAMMAFFMVMWLVGQKPETKAAIAGYFTDPYADSKNRIGAQDQPPEPTKMRGKGEMPRHSNTFSDDPNDPENKNPRLLALHGAEVTAVGAVVFFQGHDATLDEEALSRLDRLAPKLSGMPQKIEVRGHAAHGPAETAEQASDSWKLSYDRCLAVMERLKAQGVEPNRMRLAQSGVFEPLTIQGDAEARARNGRVEVVLMAELTEDLVGTPDERAARFENMIEKDEPDAADDHGDHGHEEHDSHGGHGEPVSTGHGSDSHGEKPHAKEAHDHAH